ncbi:MAG: hypothetical protein ABIH00_00050 [Armatimonadota bacterium]
MIWRLNSQKKNIYAVLTVVFLIIISASSVYGIGGELDLRLTSPKIVETDPGKIINVTFLIINRTQTEAQVADKLELPQGWQLITTADPFFTIGAQSSYLRVISFLVPSDAAAQDYNIKYHVHSPQNPQLSAKESFTIIVKSLTDINSAVISKPDMVIAGEPYTIKINYVNNGNKKVNLKLAAKLNSSFKFKIVPEEFELEAKDSQTVEITVFTKADIKDQTNSLVELEARVEGVKGDKGMITNSISVRVISKVAGGIDPYIRIPVKIEIRNMGNDSRNAIQRYFSGSGDMDESGDTKLSFKFRDPDTQDIGAFGTRDELLIEYDAKKLDLCYGDSSYTYDTLADNGAFGRGTEFMYNPGEFESGAFSVIERWVKSPQVTTAAYMKYKVNARMEIQANVLKRIKHGADVENYCDKIATLQAFLTPNDNTKIELEGALNTGMRKFRVRDEAYKIVIQGSVFKNVRYYFERIFAGPRFYGAVRDIDYMTGTVTFPVWKKIYANMYYYNSKNNVEFDPSNSIASNQRTFRTSLNYTFAFGTNISAEYSMSHYKDHLQPVDYDYIGRSVVIGLSHSFGKLTLQTNLGRCLLDDRLAAPAGIYELYNTAVSGSYSLSNSMAISTSSRDGFDAFFTTNPKKTRSANVNFSWTIAPGMSLVFTKERTIYTDRRSRVNTYSTFIYNFPNETSISLKNNWVRDNESNTDQASYYLVYTTSWDGVPVGKKTSVGAIKGRVFDGQKEGHPPIKDVILTTSGVTAMTDANGEFTFPAVPPGEQSLYILQKTIGYGRVAEQEAPVTINVKGGEISNIDIPIVNSCDIKGIVAVIPKADMAPGEKDDKDKGLYVVGSGKEQKIKGWPGVLVEASSGKEVIHQITDARGTFNFTGLRPGKWSIFAYAKKLPEFHYMEKNEFDFELKPGDTKEIEIRIIPKIRRIRIIEEGETIKIKK